MAFNGKSEACANFLARGRLVGVQGRMQSREYEDKNGIQHRWMQVIAEKVTILGPAKRGEDRARRVPGMPAGDSSSSDPGDTLRSSC